MKLKDTVALMLLSGLAMAASTGLVIPPDQPLCRLYSIIQLFGTAGGVLLAAYAGFHLATSHEQTERNNAKMMIQGAILGVIIIWLAPLVVKYLAGSSDLCGW